MNKDYAWLFFAIVFLALNWLCFLWNEGPIEYLSLVCCVLMSHLIYVEVRDIKKGRKGK